MFDGNDDDSEMGVTFLNETTKKYQISNERIFFKQKLNAIKFIQLFLCVDSLRVEASKGLDHL